MNVKFGSFDVSSVKIHFAYEGENIWVSVDSMSNLIAGGENLGASGGFLVVDAQKRYPELTEKKAVKLPYIASSGKPTENHYWYYRIDLELGTFGLHPAKIDLVETEIHQPLRDALKDELVH